MGDLKKVVKRIGLGAVVGIVLWCFWVVEVKADWSVWDEPVVYYDFESVRGDGATLIKDRVGNNDLTLETMGSGTTGIKAWGKYGWRAEFDGSDDYGMAMDSVDFSQTGSFSVEAWVKFDMVSASESAVQTVVAKWDETTDMRSYRLIVETDGDGRVWPKFQVSTDGTAVAVKTAIGTTQILPDVWYLFQGYYDATSPGNIYVYVNGVREGSASSVGTSISDTASGFYLGATKTGAATLDHFLDGSVDEVRVFSGERDEGSLAYSMERGKPVAKMSFDDGSGWQTMNRLENYTRAALVNFPSDNSQWVVGSDNYALLFDGTDDYVDLGNHGRFQLGRSMTISAWIHVSSLGNYAIVSQPQTGGYTFQLTSGGELSFGAVGGTTVTSSGAGISTGEWTNVTVSYDGTNVSFYVDGRLVSSPALSLWSVTGGSVFIGKAGTTPNYFNGKMDDVLIYAYDRTLFEVYADVIGGAVKFGKSQALEAANAQTACPEGFVHVPGDPLYGTSDFCIMKYDAKCDADGDGVGDTADGAYASCNTGYDTWGNILSGCRCIEDKGGEVVSTPQGAPIARIAQNTGGSGVDARTYCQSQGWHLVTNNEWMTMARNLERLGSNWCGLNGTGCGMSPGSSGAYLVAGHNDNGGETGTGKALQASSNDSQGCYLTTTDGSNNCGGTGSQRRTHRLSNGEVVWDLAGNLWQWTDDVVRGPNKPVGGGASWVDWPSVTDYGTLSYDVLKPSDSSWDLNKRVGRYYQGASTDVDYAFLRGAIWDYGSNAGVFTLDLFVAPVYSGISSVGFRCALSP